MFLFHEVKIEGYEGLGPGDYVVRLGDDGKIRVKVCTQGLMQLLLMTLHGCELQEESIRRWVLD